MNNNLKIFHSNFLFISPSLPSPCSIVFLAFDTVLVKECVKGMFCIDTNKRCVSLDDNINQARNSETQVCMLKETLNSDTCAPSLCLMNNQCYDLTADDESRRAKLRNGNCAALG